MSKSKDLFDESTMSFGEHLEVLRTHLWKAIIGIVICVILSLFFGNYVIAFIRSPIDRALWEHNYPKEEGFDDLSGFDLIEWTKHKFGFGEELTEGEKKAVTNPKDLPDDTIAVQVKAAQLYDRLREVAPKSVAETEKPDEEATVELLLSAPEFKQLRVVVKKSTEPVTLNVQEAFLMYLKVAMVSGFVLASPWVFYQIWLFVAAGLYPHEKRYVHIYMPFSIVLFIGGAMFCFFLVFPFILDFLLGFNKSLGVAAQIRLSEWISFAIMLPVMFGISFQLPLVMLFLEKLSIFSANDYREKRRFAILVIAIISMLLTPADPMSMVMMMLPLIVLYELGIKLCGMSPAAKSPFDEAPA